MKIKTKQLDYEKVIALPRNKKRKPKKIKSRQKRMQRNMLNLMFAMK